MRCGGIFDYENKKERLEEVNLELEDPNVWNDQEKAQALSKERASLEHIVSTIDELKSGITDADEFLQMVEILFFLCILHLIAHIVRVKREVKLGNYSTF